MGIKINKLSKIGGTLGDGSGDPLITRDGTTNQVGLVANNIGTLATGKIFIGDGSNLPSAQTISGDITLSQTGVAAISSGVIVNADINASAAIALTKLATTTPSRAIVSDGSGFLTASSVTATELGYVSGVTSSIQTQFSSKQATITGAASTVVSSNLSSNVVVVSDGSGKIASSAVGTTTLGYISTLSSDAQTQLNTKLTTSLGSLATGDIIYYNGSGWTNLPRGTSGQALYSTGTTIQWNTPTINGIPIGGSSGQYLAKNSGTDFDVSWTSLTLSKVTDVVATVAQVNALSNGFYDPTSSIQTQLNGKLSTSLAQNALFVGNASNVAIGLATGANGTILTSVSGVPTWTAPGSGGTVTSIDVSGGSTGLSATGGPVSISGTITLTGTVNPTHGGTGLTTYTTGDIPYASASNVLSKLAAGTNGYVLTMAAGVPTWAAASGGGSGTVTSASVVSANGFAGSVATATTTPAITISTTITGLLKGNGTAISAASSGTDYSAGTSALATGILKSTTTTGALTIAVAADFPTLNQNTTGSAASLTTGRTISITGDLAYTSPSFDGSGNVTATGTLATVNSNVGSFGSATQVAGFTVNAKGLITAASNTSIQIAESQVTNLVSDLAAKQATITLTTTGTSGAATFIANTLNIPQYAGISGLTTNRIPYATSSSTLGDDSQLTWNSTTNILSVDAITIGRGAGGVATNIGIGTNALSANTTGQLNVAFGYSALAANIDGQANSAFGVGALGVQNNTTSSYNTAIGYHAGATLTSGFFNTIIGTDNSGSGGITTGNQNIIIGYQNSTNLGITTGSGNVIIGNAITGLATGLTDNLIIATGLAGTIIIQDNGTTTKLNRAAHLAGGVRITSASTVGYVLTATDTLGNSSWQASAAGIVRVISNISTNTSAASATLTDYVYNCTSTFTLTLPTAVSNTNRYTVKNSGTGVITVNTTSSQTIDGTLTITITAGNSIDLISDNSNFIIV